MLLYPPDDFLIKNIIVSEKEMFKNGLIEIDDCLVDEIKDLWNKGIHTRGCCCGHGNDYSYIEVERVDIPKMIKLGYKVTPDAPNYDRFYAKSTCGCLCLER